MTYLLPRLGSDDATKLIEATRGRDLDDLARSSLRLTTRGTFPILGAANATEGQLRRVRDDIVAIAVECGYPYTSKLRGRQKFDTRAAIYVHESLGAVRGELLRDEVWQYVSCVLLPDVVCWRWRERVDGGDEPHPDRFLGGVRNCFGRLWRRADVFHDERLADPWALVRSLLEDNFTAILERPRIARHAQLAREIARAFVLRRDLVKSLEVENPTQFLLRQIMLRVRRRASHTAFGALEPDEIVCAIGDIADVTLAGMGVRPQPEKALLEALPELALELERAA